MNLYSEPGYSGFSFHEPWNIRDSLYTTLYQLWEYGITQKPLFKYSKHTETGIRRYIGIISHILTDLYRLNKRKYGLHVFIESLYNDIRENYLENIHKNFVLYSTVFCSNTGEYGAKKPVFTMVWCSATQETGRQTNTKIKQ